MPPAPPPASEADVALETAPASLADTAGLLLRSESGRPLRRLASDGTAAFPLNALPDNDFTGPGIAEFKGKPSTPTAVLLPAAAADAEFATGFFVRLSPGAGDV